MTARLPWVRFVYYSRMMQAGVDIDKRIGARIRVERETRGWSLTELAHRASVSRAMIHKVEHGSSSPTAHLLAKISGAFGLTMSTLMARAELGQGRLLRHEDQPVWVDPATGYQRRHLSPQSDMPLDLVQVRLPAGRRVPMPAAVFALMRQLIWVLQGDLTFCEGDVRHLLRAGDCLALGPPSDCVFINESDADCLYAVAVLRSA